MEFIPLNLTELKIRYFLMASTLTTYSIIKVYILLQCQAVYVSLVNVVVHKQEEVFWLKVAYAKC